MPRHPKQPSPHKHLHDATLHAPDLADKVRSVIEYIDQEPPCMTSLTRPVGASSIRGRRSAWPRWARPGCWVRPHAQGDDLGAVPRRQGSTGARPRARTITVAVIPAGYFENLIALAAAVRGAHRRQAALREGAAGADPAEGQCSTCRRRPPPSPRTRRTRCTTRCTPRTAGSSRWTSYLSDAGADRCRVVQLQRHPQGLARRRLGGTASPTACRTTARSRCRSTARTCTPPRG
jgi:hypothetical protein